MRLYIPLMLLATVFASGCGKIGVALARGAARVASSSAKQKEEEEKRKQNDPFEQMRQAEAEFKAEREARWANAEEALRKGREQARANAANPIKPAAAPQMQLAQAPTDIPEGMIAAGHNTPLLVGTPVKARRGGKGEWLDATVVDLPNDKTAYITWGEAATKGEVLVNRDSLLVSHEAKKALDRTNPDVVRAQDVAAGDGQVGDDPIKAMRERMERRRRAIVGNPDADARQKLTDDFHSGKITAEQFHKGMMDLVRKDLEGGVGGAMEPAPNRPAKPGAVAPAPGDIPGGDMPIVGEKKNIKSTAAALEVLKNSESSTWDLRDALKVIADSDFDPATDPEKCNEIAEVLLGVTTGTWAWHVNDDLLKAFAKIRTSRTERYLISRLADRWSRRDAAKILQTLGKYQTESAARAAAALMTDRDAAVPASTALREMGSVAEPVVIELSKDGHPSMRAEAYDILRVIGTEKGLLRLKAASTSEKDKQAQLTAKAAYKELDDRLKKAAPAAPAGANPPPANPQAAPPAANPPKAAPPAAPKPAKKSVAI